MELFLHATLEAIIDGNDQANAIKAEGFLQIKSNFILAHIVEIYQN